MFLSFRGCRAPPFRNAANRACRTEFVINQTAAKTSGLSIPASVHLRRHP